MLTSGRTAPAHTAWHACSSASANAAFFAPILRNAASLPLPTGSRDVSAWQVTAGEAGRHAPDVGVAQARQRLVAGGGHEVEQTGVVHRPRQQALLPAKAPHARVHGTDNEGVHARMARVCHPV